MRPKAQEAGISRGLWDGKFFGKRKTPCTVMLQGVFISEQSTRTLPPEGAELSIIVVGKTRGNERRINVIVQPTDSLCIGLDVINRSQIVARCVRQA